jgi:hypothetical protein
MGWAEPTHRQRQVGRHKLRESFLRKTSSAAAQEEQQLKRRLWFPSTVSSNLASNFASISLLSAFQSSVKSAAAANQQQIRCCSPQLSIIQYPLVTLIVAAGRGWTRR